jgi:AcrR family transcriptional regulator
VIARNPFIDAVSPDTPAEHRRRLLDGMAQVVAGKGFADATIADIVTVARVSRRTFYEHFATREACLIALYEAASGEALRVLAQAIDPARDWREQLDDALRRYLGLLASHPPLLKTMFVAVFALGDEGLAARRRANDRMVRFIIDTAGRGGALPPGDTLVTALVGGINELVLQAVEQGRADSLTELVPEVARFLVRVLDGPTH